MKFFYGKYVLRSYSAIFKRAEELRKNQTEDEKLLWSYIKSNQLGVRFKRQHPIWMYIADFYCHELKLIIELDGSVHLQKAVMENDKIRVKDLKSFGIRVIRFTNRELRNEINITIDMIKEVIKEIKENGRQNEK